MILHIELESHTNLEHVREFLTGNATGMVLIPDRKEAYEHIKRVLRRFSYWRLGKADKGLLRCYLRVDSVHQGDLAKVKGVYYINVVDEVTQYEFVGMVERISERYLIPVLEGLLGAFPFQIRGFHSDHGSEYVNY